MKTIIALILALSFSPVYATEIEDCTMVSTFAETVMRIRQDNHDMSKVISTIQRFSDDGRKWMEAIIVDAYDIPLYSTSKYKKQAIMEFKNSVFTECYKK